MMGCIGTIISEVFWSVVIGMVITIIVVLLGNDDVLGVFRSATGIVFVIAVFGDFVIWMNKLNLDY